MVRVDSRLSLVGIDVENRGFLPLGADLWKGTVVGISQRIINVNQFAVISGTPGRPKADPHADRRAYRRTDVYAWVTRRGMESKSVVSRLQQLLLRWLVAAAYSTIGLYIKACSQHMN